MLTTKPTPEQVRKWMQKRQTEKTPPASPEEIRRQLGWNLIKQSADCAR